MKLTFSSILVAAGFAATTANHVRSVQDSSCNSITNPGSCAAANDSTTGKTCVWCVAGAVPSECMSQEQANQLPPGVFECQSPGRKHNLDDKEFFFRGDRSHKLNVKEASGDDFCDPDSKSISGYMDIKGSQYDKDGEDKHLFFWMFEKRNQHQVEDQASIPFVVWLTGGPGCSSTLALLTENGPCSVNEDGETTSVNPHSWTETAHVLWLDQPAGVGFSYGKETDSHEAMVTEDAYYFLQGFMQTYPQYADSPLYIVGESVGEHCFGGSCIPLQDWVETHPLTVRRSFSFTVCWALRSFHLASYLCGQPET